MDPCTCTMHERLCQGLELGVEDGGLKSLLYRVTCHKNSHCYLLHIKSKGQYKRYQGSCTCQHVQRWHKSTSNKAITLWVTMSKVQLCTMRPWKTLVLRHDTTNLTIGVRLSFNQILSLKFKSGQRKGSLEFEVYVKIDAFIHKVL